MSGGKNQRALLMEIMIAVLFFALCASVLLRTFVTVRELSRRAGVRTDALLTAQSLANRLYAQQDMPAELETMGFEMQEGTWTRSGEGFELTVVLEEESTAAGTLQTALVRVTEGDSDIIELPVARYVPGEADV
ncbi:MAG: hypothetical protein PUC00_04020 [Clostridiales bacterium]|nr:hypothetical protein [Clostridiales bacterium]